jgi:hypothetical protein
VLACPREPQLKVAGSPVSDAIDLRRRVAWQPVHLLCELDLLRGGLVTRMDVRQLAAGPRSHDELPRLDNAAALSVAALRVLLSSHDHLPVLSVVAGHLVTSPVIIPQSAIQAPGALSPLMPG